MEPSGFRKLIFLQSNGIIAIQFCKKSNHFRIGKSPWLALVIADIFYPQSNFFHHFPVHRFLKCFPNFHKTSNQRITAIGIMADTITGHQKPVTICYSDDHSRRNFRILHLSAERTNQSPLCFTVFHHMPAPSAEFPAFLKPVNLCGCNPCKRLIHRLQIPEYRSRTKLITVFFPLHHLGHIIIASVINGKQIVGLHFQPRFFHRKIRKAGNVVIPIFSFP